MQDQDLHNLLVVAFPSVNHQESKVVLYDFDEKTILLEIFYDLTAPSHDLDKIYARKVSIQRFQKAENTDWQIDDGFEIIIEDHPATGTSVSVRKVLFYNNVETG